MATRTVDVLIVGNGIVGLSIADELGRRSVGVSVAVAGPTLRPGSASLAAGAMLGCFGEVTKDTFRTPEGRSKFEICRAAHRRWPARLDGLAEILGPEEGPLHRIAGTHVILNARSGELDSQNFASMIEALEADDEPWEEVDPLELDALNPRPDARPLRAVYLPAEGGVEGRQVLRLLERRASAAGSELIDAEVRALTTDGEGITGVQLRDETVIQAGLVVVAAGAMSASLLRTALPPDRVLPIYAGSGVALVARRVLGRHFTTVIRTPNRSGACGLHLVPLANGREYLGATNILFATPEISTYVGVCHFLAGCAMEQIDQRLFFHRIDEWRMGNRPVSLDTFPVVGWTDVPGLYVLSGTYRDGFHCSEILAEHAADELLDGAGTLAVPFSPQRRVIPNGTPDEAVEEFVRHSVAGWFEASAVLPGFVTSESLAGMARERARALYDRLDLEIGLAPEILMYLLDSRKDERDVTDLQAYLESVR